MLSSTCPGCPPLFPEVPSQHDRYPPKRFYFLNTTCQTETPTKLRTELLALAVEDFQKSSSFKDKSLEDLRSYHLGDAYRHQGNADSAAKSFARAAVGLGGSPAARAAHAGTVLFIAFRCFCLMTGAPQKKPRFIGEHVSRH